MHTTHSKHNEYRQKTAIWREAIDIHEVLYSFCHHKSVVTKNNSAYNEKLDKIDRVLSKYSKKSTEIDVLICSFPSFQCYFLLKYPKYIIFRFVHRFDHHLQYVLNADVKWGKMLHYMSKEVCHGKLRALFLSDCTLSALFEGPQKKAMRPWGFK